jgi:hypothetical protein
MVNFFKALFASKQLISNSTSIKSGFSHGRQDGSSPASWYEK